MNVPTFLVEREQLCVGRVRLSGHEGRHAAGVRRLTPGERVDLADGSGRVGHGPVAAVHAGGLDVDVQAIDDYPPPMPRLAMVQALPKADRGERAVEGMTEVGVDAIVPWAASRCVTRWSPDREHKGLARWRAKAREASKQSGRAFLPEVSSVVSTDAVRDALTRATLGLVLDAGADTAMTSVSVPTSGEVLVVVGPEGGLTPEELATFESSGAWRCRLGSTTLRTSTAGVAAAAVLMSRCGRW